MKTASIPIYIKNKYQSHKKYLPLHNASGPARKKNRDKTIKIAV